MIVIGLTGGIGMGKSTVAAMFARAGVPAFNADDAVHQLQAPGGRAIAPLDRAFPGAVVNGILQRGVLREWVLNDDAAMLTLEAIMHPLVHQEEVIFRRAAYRAQKRAVLLDIPLLFETGANLRVNVTATVSCPRAVQIQRVMRRGIAREQVEAIIARQAPDAEKRRRADYVIPTGLNKFYTLRAVRRILKELGL
ncbi:MAG: dephospho-CoA kinase [Acidocella sp. 20-63-7]|nr:MAG: dephospho-CoA kinase [Acidocella sp. 20-63-7]HQT46325.1 dephospho-CoA kinase [Acidocella sp.]